MPMRHIIVQLGADLCGNRFSKRPFEQLEAEALVVVALLSGVFFLSFGLRRFVELTLEKRHIA